MKLVQTVVFLSAAANASVENSYIDFGQFDKVRDGSIVSGGLYACSKLESLEWGKRLAYQFLHFKVEQVIDHYFKTVYRVTAVHDIPLSEKIEIVDQHKQAEAQRNAYQEGGRDQIGKSLTCEGVGSATSEILKYQQ